MKDEIIVITKRFGGADFYVIVYFLHIYEVVHEKIDIINIVFMMYVQINIIPLQNVILRYTCTLYRYYESTDLCAIVYHIKFSHSENKVTVAM